MEQTIIQETNLNLQEKEKEQELERLKLKVADLMDRLNPAHVTQKAVNLKLESDEIVGLQARADGLRKEADELSATLLPAEVYEARLRRFERTHEDALADNRVERAKGIEQEKLQFLDERKKTVEAIQALNGQIEGVEAQKKAILTPVFREVFDGIKFAFADKLLICANWIDKEFEEFLRLQEEYGVRGFINPVNEMRLFREGPWRKTRDRLDRWLP